MANNRASLRVVANAAMASAWQAEPANTVPSPPMRSATQPQNWRLTKALPSKTDSIVAPCAGAIPTSLQKATRWLDGIAIGTQHKNDAAHNTACTVLALRRNPATPRKPAEAAPPARRGCGGGLSSMAIGRINRHTPAKPSITLRQPRAARPRSKADGQITPAMYCPEEISASAVPPAETTRPSAVITAPNITMRRTPMRSAIQPITMPPVPVPTQTSAAAKAMTERSLASEAAIGLSPTTTASGAPYEIDKIPIASVAASHEARLSTLSGIPRATPARMPTACESAICCCLVAEALPINWAQYA